MEPLNENEQKAIEDFKQVHAIKKRGRPDREFGPLLKIAATVLKESGKMTNADIALELKVSPATVAKILKDQDLVIDVKDMDLVRDKFAGTVAQVVSRLLNAVNTDLYVSRLASAKNTGAVQATTALIDALQKLTGKPTSIVEVRDTAKDIAAKIKEIEELEAALKQSMVKPENSKVN